MASTACSKFSMYLLTYSLSLCSVNVKNLSHTTDIPSLAKQMVATCQLISPAPQADVEQLLLYMQARKTTNEGDAGQLFSFK